MVLIKFLSRNLKGYRFLVVLAIIVAVAQVSCDIIALQPLKWIPSKAQNPGNDPACSLPFLGLNNQPGWLDLFDTPALDPSLNPPAGGHIASPPATSPCPADPARPITFVTPDTTHHSVIGVIVFGVIVLVVFSTVSAVLVYLDLYLAAYIAQNLSARLRTKLFEHLQRISLDWHGKQKKGDLVQRITGNISDIEKFVTDGLVDLLVGTLTIGGVAAVMLFYSVPYTILSLSILPALSVIVLYYTRNIKIAAKKQAKSAGQVADVATEDINALTVIKVFTREEREDLRFGRRVSENRAAGLRAGGLQAQFTPLVAVLVALGTATIIGVGGYVAAGNPFVAGPLQILPGTIDAGLIVSFLFYLKLFYQPLRDLSKLTNLANAASAGAERIQEVLDQAPEVIESQAPYLGPTKLKGDIQFDHVVFRYAKEQEPPVLRGVNLHIPAGRKVALVGLSGGGKTTLVKLIPRFYEISEGALRVDGVDNRMYPLKVLRDNVSMVLQDSVLFEGTMRENIEVGRPGASEADIIEAAKKAQMHETIMGLGGYDYVVREQGKNLSGGQRQRIAIARAILRDAPILILDEPTASLDVESEAEVMNALDRLIGGRTVLMISHRLSTLGNVDEIIVLKDGQIVEQGSFQDLKRKNGVFAGLLAEQNRYNLEKVGNKSIIRSAFVENPDYLAAVAAYRGTAVAQLPPSVKRQPTPQPTVGAPYIGGQQAYATVVPQVVPQLTPSSQMQKARVLVVIDGKTISERLLDKPMLTIGRLSSNDVSVPNQRVSRLHAKIRSENGMWIIEDADSVNGIVYQGRRVERLVLTNGDRVYIAPSVVLHYQTQIAQ